MKNIKKKMILAAIIYLVIALALGLIFETISIILIIILAIGGLLGVIAFICNKLYLKTNHWKNQYAFEKQFITNVGYRDNINRNFDVINLGSNPARFGFFYEDVKGQNWATGSQGFAMDFEILKYFHSYLREGGFVLIPIMPFSAVSQYLSTKPEYWSDQYYMKFAKILDPIQTTMMPNGGKLLYKLRYPLLFNPKLMALRA